MLRKSPDPEIAYVSLDTKRGGSHNCSPPSFWKNNPREIDDPFGVVAPLLVPRRTSKVRQLCARRSASFPADQKDDPPSFDIIRRLNLMTKQHN